MTDLNVHEPVDLDSLQTWIDEHIDGAGSIGEIRQFNSGKANLTYLLRFTGGSFEEVVVRRPPRGRLPRGGHDMSRESFVLERLWRGFPLAPKGIAYCDDPSVIGAPFLVMERKTGLVVQNNVPSAFGGGNDAVMNRKISVSVVGTLARLHMVDPSEVDLDNLGHPPGFLTRQLSVWTGRLLEAKNGDTGEVERLRDWLMANLPEPQRVSILHNDWRLDNIALSPTDPSVCTAVYDWDMCTRGDPLADVGTLLATWYGPGERVDAFAPMPTHVAGFLSPGEAIDEYAELTGLSISNVGWYVVLGTIKMAAILYQIYNRWRQVAENGDDRFARFGEAADQLVELAHTRKGQYEN